MTTTCENDTKTCGHISTFFRVDVARVIYRNLGQGKWLPKLISPYTCSRILFVVVTKWHDYSLEEKKVSADHFVNRPHAIRGRYSSVLGNRNGIAELLLYV